MVIIEQVADFVAKALPRTAGQWPRRSLVNWLAHQWAHRCLAVLAFNGTIIGAGVAVRCEASAMTDPWTPWNDRGDCLYFHLAAANDSEALRGLMALMAHRVPDWASLELFATRHGRRVRIPRGVIQRTWQRRQAKKD